MSQDIVAINPEPQHNYQPRKSGIAAKLRFSRKELTIFNEADPKVIQFLIGAINDETIN